MNINFIDNFNKNTNCDVNVFLTTKEFLNNNLEIFSDIEFKAEFKEKKIGYCEKTNKLFISIGLGEENKLDNLKLENIGNYIFDVLNSNNFKKINLYCEFSNENCNINNDEIILRVLYGLELSNYSFNKYFEKEKQKEKECKIENINILVKNKRDIEIKYNQFLIEKENVFFCRDLVNEPSNVINPDTYSELCKTLTKYGLDIDVIGEDKMKELGMNSLLAVGQGSNFESRLVILKWKGLENFENPIAFVGKGITFDSGGICIKPDDAMYDMKCDMAGSAVVVSLMKLLAQRKAKVNAVGVIGLVENMPSGSAVKPGDIVKSMSGQTIEILHTDAEGRLILADELYYTITKFNPEMVIDLATLTGAICVGLGSSHSGIFTNNDKLAKEIEVSSKNTCENSWRMPLGELGCNYDKMINSDVADVKNISGVKFAGSITAAQFLQRFINKHTKWAHIDIAGTAFLTGSELYAAKDIYTINNGATGYGVRLLNDLVKNNYEK